jgi:hypothetical protein
MRRTRLTTALIALAAIALIAWLAGDKLMGFIGHLHGR